MQLRISVDTGASGVLCCSLFQTVMATRGTAWATADVAAGRPAACSWPALDDGDAPGDDWWDPAWDADWWGPRWDTVTAGLSDLVVKPRTPDAGPPASAPPAALLAPEAAVPAPAGPPEPPISK